MGVACLEFRGENFRGWRKNREIRENFLPRKFPAIRVLKSATVAPVTHTVYYTHSWDCLCAPYQQFHFESVLCLYNKYYSPLSHDDLSLFSMRLRILRLLLAC